MLLQAKQTFTEKLFKETKFIEQISCKRETKEAKQQVEHKNIFTYNLE